MSRSNSPWSIRIQIILILGVIFRFSIANAGMICTQSGSTIQCVVAEQVCQLCTGSGYEDGCSYNSGANTLTCYKQGPLESNGDPVDPGAYEPLYLSTYEQVTSGGQVPTSPPPVCKDGRYFAAATQTVCGISCENDPAPAITFNPIQMWKNFWNPNYGSVVLGCIITVTNGQASLTSKQRFGFTVAGIRNVAPNLITKLNDLKFLNSFASRGTRYFIENNTYGGVMETWAASASQQAWKDLFQSMASCGSDQRCIDSVIEAMLRNLGRIR